MLNKFKRAMYLALALALLCAVSTNTLAVNIVDDPHVYRVNEDYDDSKYMVSASAEITRYSSYGCLDFYPLNADNLPEEDAYLYVEGSVTVVPVDNNHLDEDRREGYVAYVTWSSYDSGTEYAGVSKGWSSSEITSTVSASYDFFADVPTSYGYEDFTPDTANLIW